MAVAAGAAFLVSVATLSFVFRALGIPVSSPVAQASTLIAFFVFYMGMRRIKLSAGAIATERSAGAGPDLAAVR